MNRFINWAKANHRKNQIIAAIVIGGSGAILFLALGIDNFYEEQYIRALGATISFLFMLFFIVLVFINPGKYKMNRIAKKIKKDMKQQSGDLQIIYTSKDRIMIVHIEEVLKEHGIKCFIFDEQANSMMRFIDGMEMRVLVHKDDYEKGMSVIDSIKEKGDNFI